MTISLYLQLVEGELYEVDDQMLRNLDDLEGHPDLYTRLRTNCQITDDGTIVECEAYFMRDFKDALLQWPFLACYDPKGSDLAGYDRRSAEISLWDMKEQ